MRSIHDPYAALRYRNYRLFTIGGNVAVIGSQMTAVAVGWELYARTGQAISLAWVGLVHALPVIVLALPAGHLADRLNRRRILLTGLSIIILCSLGLAAISHANGPLYLYYLCIFVSSIAGTYSGPARGAILPQLVPPELLINAVTWNSSVFQVAAMVGPALGGGIYALESKAAPVYLCDAACSLTFLTLLALIRIGGDGSGHAASRRAEPANLRTLIAGLRFVWEKQIILATITLDLFAVLLGGAVSLLPIYAKDILHVGPHGLGLLRAAPSAGAFMMAITLAHRPPLRKAGAALLWAVAGFGAATIVFGFTRFFWLSMLMLFLTGAFDNISVVVRHTLVLTLTPDEMRGRVNAVNNVFISASNDLGAFESGVVAQLFGPVVSVVSGGVGTILVVILTAVLWPEIRRFGPLGTGGHRTPAA